MVYRSFGKEVPQNEIWPAIAKLNRFGSLASTTHLMALDALGRGFAAVAIQARHPLQALGLCRETGVRAILNHRLQPDSPAGHYSVLVDLDDKNVVLHDPLFGPSRRLSHAELLDLWQPRFSNSEIVGSTLIAVSAERPEVRPCRFCRSTTPPYVECPRCNRPVGLQPGALLGCLNNGCIARMWNYICCPSCDYTWTFDGQPQQSGAPRSPGLSSPPPPDPQAAQEVVPDLNRLFVQLDKFCSQILSVPGVGNNLEVKAQLDFITNSKQALTLALAEGLAHGQVRKEQLNRMQEAARQKEEAHRQKVEKLNTPSPPLDGDALGRALLKNFGFDH
jgi:hypothetical protein